MTGGAPARIVRGRILSFHDEPRLAGEAALTLIERRQPSGRHGPVP